jgi:hypothetical protein
MVVPRAQRKGLIQMTPAFDYHLPKLSFHDKTPVVVRWCEDCAMIQGFPGAYKIAL